MQHISSRPCINISSKHTFTIRKYSCSFLPYHTDVYNIVAPKKILHSSLDQKKNENQNENEVDLQLAHYKDIIFFTTPLIKRFNGEAENVLVSFLCPHHAEFVKNDVMKKTSLPLQVCRTNLKDYSYHGTLLKTPLVTIMNGMCSIDDEKSEQYELFYTSRYLTDIEDYPI